MNKQLRLPIWLLTVVILFSCSQEHELEKFVLDVVNCPEDRLDSIFNTTHPITANFKVNTIGEQSAKDYFNGAFLSFRDGVGFIGVKDGLIPKKFIYFNPPESSDTLLEVRIIAKNTEIQCHFQFKLEKQEWLLSEINFHH